MTKLALMKAAQQRLQNVFMFEFQDVKFDFATVMFTCLKLNRQSIVDIDFIIQQFSDKTKLEGAEGYFNCDCAIHWKIILEVMANQQYDESKIDFAIITRKETEKFKDYKTISKFFKHQEDLIFGIGSSLNKVQKEKDIKRVWFQEKYDNDLKTYQKSHQLLEKRKYNNEDILNFVEDGQVWDIDEQEKLWIFSIFSVDDLVECFF
jgi:phenylpropionate dioxygenase-like ring-hydroxylating dioxygenase large terminal subunit